MIGVELVLNLLALCFFRQTLPRPEIMFESQARDGFVPRDILYFRHASFLDMPEHIMNISNMSNKNYQIGCEMDRALSADNAKCPGAESCHLGKEE